MNSNNSNDYLPQDLIFSEILPKLPVKSLIRFKSVSKPWYYTISSSKFAKTHLKFSSSHPHFLILINSGRKLKRQIFSLSYDELTCHTNEFLELKYNIPFKYPEIVGSCNGLVCLLVNHDAYLPKSLYIWNPATYLHRQITFPKDESEAMPSWCVLHYAPSTDDYKIFAAFLSKADEFAHFYVFSLRGSGTWERICALDEYVRINDLGQVVLFHDTLYFTPATLVCAKTIVGFDLVAEEFKELPSMKCLVKSKQVRLMQLRGSLSLVCHSYYDSVVDVWMLKQSSELNSWEKAFSINLRNVQYYSFSETTGKCLVRINKGKIKVVDPSRESTLQVHQRGNDVIYSPMLDTDHIVGYVESLVSPFG